MVNPSKPVSKVNHKMASISETASDAENRSMSIEYMRSLQAAATEGAPVPLPSKTRTASKTKLPPRPVLESKAGKRPTGGLPPMPPRAEINLSSSVSSHNEDDASTLSPAVLFGDTDVVLEADGDVLLSNHEGHIMAVANMYGRVTLSQIAVHMEKVKGEGSYSKVKNQTFEEYRENSVRRRVAKLVKFGYLKRMPNQSGKNSVFLTPTYLGRQISTVKGNLQRDLLSPNFHISQLDLVRHNAMLSSTTAAIRVQAGQFDIEKYDHKLRGYRKLTVKDGLNIIPGPAIYDAAKEIETDDPIALQRAVTESFMINTSPGNNRSGLEPYPQVRGGAIPLTGSHSSADKRLIQNHMRRGISATVGGVEYNAVPAAFMFAPNVMLGDGSVVLASIVHFAIPMPNHVEGDSITSGSIVAHVDSTGSDSADGRMATLYHLMTFGYHAFVAICSDRTMSEKVKQDWTNALRLAIEKGLLAESARHRLLFISYDLINSKGVVDTYVPTTERYAVTPAMG